MVSWQIYLEILEIDFKKYSFEKNCNPGRGEDHDCQSSLKF
jgi:hypothetical protein